MNYQQHRQSVLSNITTSDALVVLSAASVVQRSADTNYPFHQDSNFRYVSGYNQPGALLVFNRGGSWLFIEQADDTQQLWEGRQPSQDEIKQVAAVDEVLDISSFDQWVSKRRDQSWQVPRSEQQLIGDMQLNDAQQRLVHRLQRLGVEATNCAEAFAEARRVKDSAEITALDSAVKLTLDSFASLDLSVDYEYQLAAQFTAAFTSAGAEHGYQPIAAAGNNACTLHYTANSAQLGSDQFVLIDVGAEIDGYSADITRIVPLGSPPIEQQEIVELVEGLQQRAIARLKPGLTIRDWSVEFRQDLLEQAQDAGLLKVSAKIKDTINLMPHGLGHYLGLDVHDPGDYDAPLEPGVVLTVEPGIYLPERGYGVRIEDDIVITADGCRRLGQ